MLKLLGNVIIAVKFWSTQSPLGFLQSVAYTSRVLSYMREGLCIEETLSLSKLERLGLVADPVIEAIAKPEFEDGLRTGVHHGGCWGP